MTITTLAIVLSAMTHQPCAVIDNKPNLAAWKIPGQSVQVSHYMDFGDDPMGLGYDRPVPKRAWKAVASVEQQLQKGKPSHKVQVSCK